MRIFRSNSVFYRHFDPCYLPSLSVIQATDCETYYGPVAELGQAICPISSGPNSR